jgi:hypothetical protein
MEVIHDSAFWRDFSRARPAAKNGGAEYRVEKTDSGFAISGPALGKPSFFNSEDKALSLARHIIGPKGGSITRVANGKTTRQRVPAKLAYTPSGHQRDAELEEYDGKFPLPLPDEPTRQAVVEFIQGETKKSQSASRTRCSKRDIIGSARHAAPVISSKFRATVTAGPGLFFPFARRPLDDLGLWYLFRD